jgi:hypothetical protein
MARYSIAFDEKTGETTRRTFTADEEAKKDSEESADAEYWRLNGYRENRQAAYPPLGDQLDMQYHDLVNGTTTWKDHVAKVKTDNAKPE